MKYGIELEEFYLLDGEVAVVRNRLPHDSCGWLVEYRGQPFLTPFEAVGSVLAERERVQRLLNPNEKTLRENFLKIPRKVKLAARREYDKGRLSYQNLYGKQPSKLDHAGVHISFTHEVQHYTPKGKPTSKKYNLIWDFPTLFKKLDQEFAKEIKAAKRVPGFYELKSDGRIEYRSLPATIDLWRVAEFLQKERV